MKKFEAYPVLPTAFVMFYSEHEHAPLVWYNCAVKLRPAIIVVALMLSCFGPTACDQTPENTNRPVKVKSELSGETTTPAQWQPKIDTEGQLKIQVEPANAKIDLVSLGEQDGILPVKIKVLDFGHNNGNPNNRKENWDAHLRLERRRFISQIFSVTELNREVIQVLVRVSFEPAKIRESFKRAAQAYRMPVAYPTYIPWGYELDMNEFHAGARGEADNQPRGTWFLIWKQGISQAEWGHGTSSITMRFLAFAEGRPNVLMRSGRRGNPEKFTIIELDDRIKAKLSDHRAIFLVDGVQTWETLFENVPRAEAEKVVKGMRFVEYVDES